MTTFEFDAAETLAPETTRLSKPGKYHVCITEVRTEQKNGESIDGFQIECDVMAGDHPEEAGSTLSLTLYNPSGDNEASRRIAKQAQTAFFIATCQIDPNALGKPCKIDLADANGRQIIIDVDRQKKKEGGKLVDTKYMKVNYSNIYHVDDPEVAKVPKDMETIGLIPANQRRKPEYFAFKAPKNAKPVKEEKKQDWKDVDL